LTVKSIKIKSIDEKSQYFHPSRTVEIRTNEGRVLTPNRASTIYEFNQKIAIPAITPIDNPISMSVKKMNKNKLELFLKENGLYKNWYRRLIESDEMMRYSILRAHIIQPTTSQIVIKNADGSKNVVPSGIEFLANNPNLQERFVRLIIKMQIDADLDVISIPFLNFPLSEYKRFVTLITKQLHSMNKEPLFVFDLQYQKRGDKFEEAMNFFIKQSEIRLLAFANRSFNTAPISYDILSQYVHSDIVFLSFEVDRSDSRYDSISKMHYFPFIGNDVYSVKTPRFIPDPNKPKFERKLEQIKFFNPKNLLIENSNVRLSKPAQILDEIHESSDKWLKTILNNVNEASSNQDKISVVNALSKIHELKSSTEEFTEVQKRIKSGESTEYIKEKEYLENTLSVIRKKKRTH